MTGTSDGFREPTDGQRRLVDALLARASSVCVDAGWRAGVRVAPLEDGGMGSFRLTGLAGDAGRRAFARAAAELSFRDADGVVVSCALYLDADGVPLEVDVWRVDFGRVLAFPGSYPDVEV